MQQQHLEKIKHSPGFIAALDQSGGSTPKALALYGVKEDGYQTEEEMFDLVHAMRTRLITAPAFDSRYIIGAILFEQTMDRQIEGKYTADYLAEVKGVVPFLKVDKGLAEPEDGVQLMKPMPELADLLKRANERHIFGTKMRSLIHEANPAGIKKVVEQQFEVAKQIIAAGLMPIIEPEVSVESAEKEQAEAILREEILSHLDQLGEQELVMLKLTIPSVPDFYEPLIKHPKVVRVVALSGGYSREEANKYLAMNHGLIASFSRALAEGLSVDQSEEEFNATLQKTVEAIYQASIT